MSGHPRGGGTRLGFLEFGEIECVVYAKEKAMFKFTYATHGRDFVFLTL